MSSAARWTHRLPRSLISATRAGRIPRTIRNVGQRRWLRQQPRSRGGLPGARQRKDNENQMRGQLPPLPPQQPSQPAEGQQPGAGRNTQLATTLAESDTSDLVAEVHIPDDAGGVLPKDHPAMSILGNSSLVIQRQIEMMNIMMGFEQANKYIIMDGQGQTLGYIAEQDHGIGRAMARQLARTHRSFTTHIFDAQEREVLRIHRPFAYINSRIRIYDPVPEGGYTNTESSTALQGTSTTSVTQPAGSSAQISPLRLEEMRIIGEAQQQWAPLRRKYNLFTYRALEPAPSDPNTPRLTSGDQPNHETTALTEASAPSEAAVEAGMAQFAHINEPLLSWDFTLRDESSQTVGSVNRNFSGFAREIFTDTGVYALRMDSAAQTSALEDASGKEVERYEREARGMTLDQRAVMLATAVSIDFDYFSRHSHAGSGGFMPIFWPIGGGAAEGGAVGAGAGAAGAGAEAGAVGAAEGAGAIGSAAGRGAMGAGSGVAESGIAGAGTMAGYEAMQRGVYGQGQPDQQQQQPPPPGQVDDASPQTYGDHEFSQGPEQMENRPGEDDVWGTGNDPWADPGQSAGGGGGDGGGGGWLDTLSDWFNSS